MLAACAAGLILGGCTTVETAKEEEPPQQYSPQQHSSSNYIQIEEKSGAYVIQKGDEVELTVFGYPEFSAKTVVRDDGSITLPLVGDIRAEGITKDLLIENLKVKLGEFIKGEIKPTLTVTSPNLKKITVLGAVNHQDNFPAREELSLSEVLALAGGASLDSDLHRVKITRGERSSDNAITVDMAGTMDEGDLNSLPTIRPGDIVYIPKRENVVRDFSDFLRDAFFIFSFFRVVY